MRWIAGLDFNDRCTGALQMAAWLRANAQADLVALHVLPDSARRMLLIEAIASAPEVVVENMRRLVAQADIEDPFTEYRADWASSAEEGLGFAAQRVAATGVLIGKAAGGSAPVFGGLGRVARRLLRQLPAPVMVVPRDLAASGIGKGPIMLATLLDSSSVPAAAAADALAKALQRNLVVVAVEEVSRHVPVLRPEAFVPLSVIERLSVARVREWTSSHGIETTQSIVREGERVQVLLDVAREQDAAVIVCGSRCLSLAQRIFASSTASELARCADRPVLVVPGQPPEAGVRT